MKFPLSQKYLNPPLYLYLKDKTGCDDEEILKIRIEECLKFLSLIHYSYGDIPVSKEIDDIWHLLILETREYMDLCEKLPGGKYIHHQSRVLAKYLGKSQSPHFKKGFSDDSAGDGPMIRSLSWLVSYVACFGRFTAETIAYWPAAQELLNDIKFNLGSLEDLNHLLESLAQSQSSEPAKQVSEFLT